MASSQEEDLYDLVPEDPPASRPVQPTPDPLPPAARPVLGYRGSAPSESAATEPETIRDLYMPLWLLGGGIAIEVVAAFLTEPRATLAMTSVGVNVLLGTAVMLIGIRLAAYWRQIDLGDWRFALLKLAAISIAPAAAVTLAEPVLRLIPLVGWILGLIGMFVLYFALLGALFDLDESDTWYCVCVIFLVRLGVYFGWMAIAAGWN